MCPIKPEEVSTLLSDAAYPGISLHEGAEEIVLLLVVDGGQVSPLLLTVCPAYLDILVVPHQLVAIQIKLSPAIVTH